MSRLSHFYPELFEQDIVYRHGSGTEDDARIDAEAERPVACLSCGWVGRWCDLARVPTLECPSCGGDWQCVEET